MNRNTRIGLLAAAAVVIIAAAVIIGSGGSDKSKTTSSAAAQTTPGGSSTPAKPAVPVIRIQGGKAVGGVQKVVVNKGGQINFTVQSDADHDIHVHGFNVLKKVKAGGSVSFSLKGDAAGIYEVEIEETSTKIGELKVNP